MKKFILIIALLFNQQIFCEGFLSGTLVKTPYGYIEIEKLKEDYPIISYSFKKRQIVQSKVTKVQKKIVQNYYQLFVDKEIINVDGDQRFFQYCGINHWIRAKNLQLDQQIKDKLTISEIRKIDQPVTVYLLSVKTYHNFFVTKYDIPTHNFAIPIFTYIVGEGFALASVSTILAAIGISLYKEGVKKIGKSMRAEIYESPNSSPSSDPNDPENKKKKEEKPNGDFEETPYHHPKSRNWKSPSPKNGQRALNNSIEVKNSDQRIAIDDNKFVVLKRTSPGKYHGYVVENFKSLDPKIQSAFARAGLANMRGKILI